MVDLVGQGLEAAREVPEIGKQNEIKVNKGYTFGRKRKYSLDVNEFYNTLKNGLVLAFG